MSALDFDDQSKASQAVETAGCSVQYPDGSSICVAIGNNPYAGGFIYLVGSFQAPPLVSRERGELSISDVHRARVSLTQGGQTQRWIAPFERLGEPDAPLVRGRLTGFVDDRDNSEALPLLANPVRDFRGWLWQSGRCADPKGEIASCARRTFFSIRLPVEAYREALFGGKRPVWPPADLDRTLVHVQMLAPDSTVPLFDSNAPGATVPLALSDLSARAAARRNAGDRQGGRQGPGDHPARQERGRRSLVALAGAPDRPPAGGQRDAAAHRAAKPSQPPPATTS